MSENAFGWNDAWTKDWMGAQQKYWETWSQLAGSTAAGSKGFGAANPFASAFANNPFTANAAAANPFASAFANNPFTANAAAANPFASAFTANASAANPFAANPFANAFGQNPFAAVQNAFGLDQWWQQVAPMAKGEIGTIAERFYDMGKTFMGMAENTFAASSQEQPQVAMDFWMSSLESALSNWIAQIQANMDVATPDLPGVSGTTLDGWARLADSIAPWLHTSQDFLKDIANGHMPGGIEMPGVGAAQEQLCRALSMPGLGYSREQQEHLQSLARHLITYHEALRAYKLAFAKTALKSIQAVHQRSQQLTGEGKSIESLRALYDMWVDASEEVYGEFAMGDEYQVVYGDLVNSLMQVRKDLNEVAEGHYRMMNLPTRSEMDTVQRRQQENRRETAAVRREVQSLRVELAALRAGVPAQPTATRAPAAAAQSESAEPAIDATGEDDLTAIKGIGPKMAEKLYEQGIKSFEQLAALSNDYVEQLDKMVKSQGRIMREDWIGQAKSKLD